MPSEFDNAPTLEALSAEERELVLPMLDEAVAYEIGSSAVELAEERSLPVTIGVWRANRQLFHCGLKGSTADNDQWLRRKGRVVMRFEHSSLYVARLCHDQGVTLPERFALPASRYSPFGGAVPLRVRNAGVVGWFGVSGLPQVEDHEFVVEVLRAHLAAVALRPD